MGGGGGEARAEALVGGDAQNHVGLHARGDHHSGAGAGGKVGGLDLGAHTAGAARGAGTAGDGPDMFIDQGHLGDQAGAGVAAGVGAVEAGNIGEDEQRVGVDEAGDEGGEIIVVADADLGSDDGIVLVDNRHNVALQAEGERVAGVEVAPPVAQVVAGEQGLGHLEAIELEELLVEMHQAALADGGEHLFEGHAGAGLGLRRGSEALAAGGHGAGGDEQHLDTARVEGGHLAGEANHVGPVEPISAGGEHAGAELDDEAADGCCVHRELL